MDTEFPGVVTTGVLSRDSKDYQYQTIRANVDLMKLIQFGIAIADEC
jgi:CCR4-NOT transcription complex subunit 7/8